MTCIIGLVDKKEKKVIIGADSAGSSGYDLSIRKDPKVFVVGEFVIGACNSFRMMQILRFQFIPPEIKHKDIYKYMCTDFIEEIRNCFRNMGYLQKDDDGCDKGGTFLVGYKDRLFRIDNDFQVGESFSGIESIGSGSSYALGALFESKKNSGHSPRSRVIDALEAASYFSSSVCKPFILKST